MPRLGHCINCMVPPLSTPLFFFLRRGPPPEKKEPSLRKSRASERAEPLRKSRASERVEPNGTLIFLIKFTKYPKDPVAHHYLPCF
jgi:hypothetical protein